MDYSAYTEASAIFNGRPIRRDCIDCANVATPACPACPSGQSCVQNIQTCTSCVTTSCIASSSTGQQASSSAAAASAAQKNDSPNTGAIAGGVIGGLVVIAAVVYLVWRHCIKNKRQLYEQEDWADEFQEPGDAEKDFSFKRDQRTSTHTVGSIASTVLTRASNIIQIAYIPGMTGRSTPSTPGLLVPPVPPIPIALGPQASPAYTDEHFFMPGDLRDSTYSNMTALSHRESYATRHSVASTIYGRNAVVQPVQPQMIVRGKAAVVSVKSGAVTPGTSTPPVPSIDYDKFNDNVPARSPSPTFSVGSTFLNSASASQRKPQLIGVGSVKTVDMSARPPRTPEAPSPFADPSETSSPSSSTSSSPASSPIKRVGSLSDIITNVAAKATDNNQTGSGKTPFGDEHKAHP